MECGSLGGVGAGFSARLNPFDTGVVATPGFDFSVRGQANYNLGTLGGGGFGLQHSFTSGTDTANGSFSVGLGSNVSGTISVLNDNTIGGWTAGPTWGVGTSVFGGIGGTWASTVK